MKAQKIEISGEEAEALLARVQDSTVAQDDYKIIKASRAWLRHFYS
jgi:hypothetical protein